MAMSFVLLMTSVMFLAFFLAELKPMFSESVAFLFFGALLAVFPYLYYLQYVRLLAVREELREYIVVCRKTET